MDERVVANASISGDIRHDIAASTASATSASENLKKAEICARHSSRLMRPFSNWDQARDVMMS